MALFPLTVPVAIAYIVLENGDAYDFTPTVTALPKI